MTRMRELVESMQSLEDRLVGCMKCGLCQAVCPLYAETGREADVARGKLALLEGLLQELFDDPQGVAARLHKCLLCGSCAANCPSGVNALEIFLQARAVIAGYQGLSPAKKAVFRGLLARPALFDRLTGWGARFQKVFSRPVNDVVGTSCGRALAPLIGDRHFRPLATVPFHREVPSLDRPAGASGLRVAYYVGCLADKFFPSVARSVVEVLDHHGVGLSLPAGQACCGIPALSGGDSRTFQRLVRHNLERFEGERFDWLVTACATCTSTIKKLWPAMTGADPDLHRRTRRLAGKVLDINAFLVNHVGLNPAPAVSGAPVVTYHDPCHLKKSLKVFQEPRAVIAASTGWRLREMKESDWCCGMGGSFNLQHYELSGRIGQRKREQIQATGCQVVATGCPACMLQISDALSRGGAAVAVRHPVELYAASLKSS